MKTLSSFQIILASTCLVFSTAFQANIRSQSRTFSQPMRSNQNPMRIRNAITNSRPSLALNSAVTNAMSEIDTFYQTAPYTAAFMTCSFKASAADLLAQFREIKTSTNENADGTTVEAKEQSKDRIEFERNVAFILYGGIYQGMVQYYIYNILFPLWFGHGNDLTSVAIKVAFDMLVISPFLCLPVAYLTKSTIYGKTLKEGFDKYIYDLQFNSLWTTYVSIWLPVQCITFGIIPEHLRIAFIALVSFFWLIILSTISATEEKETVQQ